MAEYVGLDVSMKETAVSVRRDGMRVWRGRCPSDPKVLAELLRRRASEAAGIIFETGPLSIWFYHARSAEGLPVVCIDARHAKAALDMAANKTDTNDADGLARLAEVGFFRAVRVKGFDSMVARTLISARTKLVMVTTDLSNQIRGLMKTFVLIVPAGKGSRFEASVRTLLVDQHLIPPRSAAVGSLARRSPARNRAHSPAHCLCSPEPSVSDTHVGAGDRCSDCDALRERDRGSGKLQPIAIDRRLARTDDQTLSIRRGRL